jgi:hypothetical protein
MNTKNETDSTEMARELWGARVGAGPITGAWKRIAVARSAADRARLAAECEQIRGYKFEWRVSA